jgi:uncharacterized protein (TIGR02996 family)
VATAVVEALEDQLRANPDDAGAWLVYADHLIEVGDARGMLVRAPRRITTQELARWRGVIPAGCATRWLHGFIVAIELPLDERMPHTLATILGEPQARLVGALCLRPPGHRDVKLHVAGDVLVADPLAGALALDLRRFRTLSIQHVQLDIAALAAARVGPLVALDLPYGELGDAGIARLVGSPLLDGVRTLQLQRNGITEEGARLLAGCPRLAALERLDLRWNAIGADGARAIASSPHLGRLAKLLLYPEDIGREGIDALATARTLPLEARRYWSARA